MRTKTWIVLLLSLLAFTARAAVIPIKITDFPRTNTIPAEAFFLIAITNSVENTNYGFTYTNLFRQITSAIPVVINSFTNGSNFFTVGGDWTNIGGFIRPVGGSTNTIKVDTNNNRGISISDAGIAASYFGWPSDGQSYLSVYDGSTGHLLNRWTHGVMQSSTTNGSYAVVTSQSGVNPTLTEAFVVLTNGVIASEFDINMQRTGSYLLLGGNVNDGFVGIQHGAQVSTPIGPNLIRAKWGTFDRFFLSTNGAVTFFGSATNYGIAYFRSNLVVSGDALFADSVAVAGGVFSVGLTNTLGFNSAGPIQLGGAGGGATTTSSNVFRAYGPAHIHDLLYLQHVAIDPGNLLYVTAGRNLATITGVNSTTAGYLAGVTSLIQPQLNSKQHGAASLTNLAGNPNVATNISGGGNVTVSSNNLGGWTISGTGANPNTATNILGAGTVTVTSNNLGEWTITGTAGAGGSGSLWTNQSDLSVFRTIAGSTNFIGGGRLNVIATNNVYATVSGGTSNIVSTVSSFSAIGGGSTNLIGTNSPAAVIAGGNGNRISANATHSAIGGGYSNLIQDSSYGSTISGGSANRAGDGFTHFSATVGGGAGNLATGSYSTVGGGSGNSAIGLGDVIAGGANSTLFGISGGTEGFQTLGGGEGHTMFGAPWATIGGGAGNIVNVAALGSTIAGGTSNVIQSGVAPNESPNSFIGGGYSNTIVYPGPFNVIGGGLQNTLRATHGFVGGGYLNVVQKDSGYSAIAGGYNNNISSNASRSFIGGGEFNTVFGVSGVNSYSVVAGGYVNKIGDTPNVSSPFSTIAGGHFNQIRDAEGGFIGGGYANVIRVNTNAAILGGYNNTINSGAAHGTILGGRDNQIGITGTTSGEHSFILGSFLANTNNYTVDIGVTNNAKVSIDRANLHLIGNMALKMTNGAQNNYVLTSDVNGVGRWDASGGGGGGSGSMTNVTNSIWVDAGAMRATHGSTADGGLVGATASTWTNAISIWDTWDFDDTTNECVQFRTTLDPTFTGPVRIDLHWAVTNTLNGASNIVWGLAATPLATNNLAGQWIYVTNKTDRFWSSNSLQITTMPTITLTNYSPRHLIDFRISRLGTNTADAALGDARLLGAQISYITSQ